MPPFKKGIDILERIQNKNLQELFKGRKILYSEKFRLFCFSFTKTRWKGDLIRMHKCFHGGKIPGTNVLFS